MSYCNDYLDFKPLETFDKNKNKKITVAKEANYQKHWTHISHTFSNTQSFHAQFLIIQCLQERNGSYFLILNHNFTGQSVLTLTN